MKSLFKITVVKKMVGSWFEPKGNDEVWGWLWG